MKRPETSTVELGLSRAVIRQSLRTWILAASATALAMFVVLRDISDGTVLLKRIPEWVQVGAAGAVTLLAFSQLAAVLFVMAAKVPALKAGEKSLVAWLNGSEPRLFRKRIEYSEIDSVTHEEDVLSATTGRRRFEWDLRAVHGDVNEFLAVLEGRLGELKPRG